MCVCVCVCVCMRVLLQAINHAPEQCSVHLTRQKQWHDAVEAASPAQGQKDQSAACRGPWLGGDEQLRKHLVRDAHSVAAVQDVRQACSQLVLALHSSPNPLSTAHGLMPTKHTHATISSPACVAWPAWHATMSYMPCSGDTHQDVVLAHHLVQECVAGAEVRWKDCVLIGRPAALHLQRQLSCFIADIMINSHWHAHSKAGRRRLSCRKCMHWEPCTPERLCAGCAQQCSM